MLEDGQLLAAFERDSGALTRLESKPRIGSSSGGRNWACRSGSMRPCPGAAITSFWGRKQRPSRSHTCQITQVRIQWEGFGQRTWRRAADHRHRHVTLTNGALTFGATLQNDSRADRRNHGLPLPRRPQSARRPAARCRRGTCGMAISSPASSIRASATKKAIGAWISPPRPSDRTQSLFFLIQAPHEGLYVEMARSHPALFAGIHLRAASRRGLRRQYRCPQADHDLRRAGAPGVPHLPFPLRPSAFDGEAGAGGAARLHRRLARRALTSIKRGAPRGSSRRICRTGPRKCIPGPCCG